VLWMEADRMATPLALADSAHFARMRAVVSAERALRVDNRTFGTDRDVIRAAMYPTGHPYHSPSLTPATDLNRATAADVRAFCLPYYVPNNALIALSGDFSTRQAAALVDKYFATIPRGADVARPRATPMALDSERRLVLEDARA